MARKIRISARDAKPVGHHFVSLTNREWRLDPAVNTEGLRPHWQTRASTLCRILLRLHFPPPVEPIDHQPDQERGLPQSNNNLAAHGLESAPQLKNRGLPLYNFAATSSNACSRNRFGRSSRSLKRLPGMNSPHG